MSNENLKKEHTIIDKNKVLTVVKPPIHENVFVSSQINSKLFILTYMCHTTYTGANVTVAKNSVKSRIDVVWHRKKNTFDQFRSNLNEIGWPSKQLIFQTAFTGNCV